MPRCGPSGGIGGSAFNDEPRLQAGTRVASIELRSGDLIDAIQVTYRRGNGTLDILDQHGGNGGKEQNFALGAGEHITRVSGDYGNIVHSIRIQTNIPNHVLTGGKEVPGSVDYTYEAPPGFEIVGFHGRADPARFINAIGVVLRAI
jgi:hypothetical protein